MKIAIIGKGIVGSSLGNLCTSAGHDVVYGTRENLHEPILEPCDIVLLAIPFTAIASVVPKLASQVNKNKILIDATNPIKKDYSTLDEKDVGAKSAAEAILVERSEHAA